MNQAIFTDLSNAFSERVKKYRRAENVESLTGLMPCFYVTGHDAVTMPDLKVHFKGGAEMALLQENFSYSHQG